MPRHEAMWLSGFASSGSLETDGYAGPYSCGHALLLATMLSTSGGECSKGSNCAPRIAAAAASGLIAALPPTR
jgi:hypothetical protein